MGKESESLALAWVSKSESDLSVARLLIEGNEPHLDAGVYFCQQAAEKIIKAFLTRAEIAFPKSHNLETLLSLMASQFECSSDLADDCRLLTPYASEF